MLNLGGRFVNQWAYQSPSGVVLVDTGYQNGYPRFRRRLARHGIPLSQVRYVFLTHAHDDHAGFLNEILRDAPDCRVILSPRSIPVLRRGQNSFSGGCTSRLALRFCRWMAAAGRGSHRFPPLEERFLSRCIPVTGESRASLEAQLGGQIVETPGHTADSLSLLLEDGSLFCGDAAMNGFPSQHRITIWAEDPQAFADSWQTILRLRPSLLYPGHGSPFPPAELARNLDFARQMPCYPLPQTE